MSDKPEIRVTSSPFLAKADGITNDRKAIQQAIDYVYSLGGGTVILDGGKTFLSTGIVIKSNVTLFFEDNAVLLQSPLKEDYVKPVGDAYEPYTPVIGHNYSETIKWSHTWYKNYPFIFAPEGSHHFKISGNGTLRMSECTDPEKLVRTCPIGFYRVHDFEISDITINNYHGYAMMPFTCKNGLFKNLKIFEWSFGNGDGICMMNCQNMRVTGCKMYTGDDSVYIFSSYRDPRAGEWWSSDEPQPSINIEIDHNDLESNHCKAFGMILWGIDCPDLEKVEVRNLYIHDNHFKTMGNWLFNPYTTNPAPHPVTHVRFENNVIDAIESNFFETEISDMNLFRSMRQMHNGDFKDGRVYWLISGDGITIHRGENPYAEFNCTESGVSLYQGLYIKAAEKCIFFVTGKTDGCTLRMFVKEQQTGKTVVEKEFCCTEKQRTELLFNVPSDGNYHVGIESTSAGCAEIYETEFTGNIDTGTDYNRITKQGGKIIYYYD
ncbi:MAG: glycosyl hydrolase family 28 protein [Clostridia bacterium]|nr:glycosyl hydrolase family 28 protein [Clostridia bacterium]